ncbi:unnamed protein product [Protopolystoma xenopodis]|uniref:Uncharacterized protein n=1 Tax=Protopolystoma xenopodis TaxID=117903 RepID=A0A3S5B0S7_9PLAT|nr:unnamed protein product [Protopolystoma xenopodis]
MTPSSDDVHHMMDKNSARFHPKLRQHEYRIKSKRLQYNDIHLSSSEIARLYSSEVSVPDQPPSQSSFSMSMPSSSQPNSTALCNSPIPAANFRTLSLVRPAQTKDSASGSTSYISSGMNMAPTVSPYFSSCSSLQLVAAFSPAPSPPKLPLSRQSEMIPVITTRESAVPSNSYFRPRSGKNILSSMFRENSSNDHLVKQELNFIEDSISDALADALDRLPDKEESRTRLRSFSKSPSLSPMSDEKEADTSVVQIFDPEFNASQQNAETLGKVGLLHISGHIGNSEYPGVFA